MNNLAILVLLVMLLRYNCDFDQLKNSHKQWLLKASLSLLLYFRKPLWKQKLSDEETYLQNASVCFTEIGK